MSQCSEGKQPVTGPTISWRRGGAGRASSRRRRKAGGHAQVVVVDRREVDPLHGHDVARRRRLGVLAVLVGAGPSRLAVLQRLVEQRWSGALRRARPLDRRLRPVLTARFAAGIRVPAGTRDGGRAWPRARNDARRGQRVQGVRADPGGRGDGHGGQRPVRARCGRPVLGLLRRQAARALRRGGTRSGQRRCVLGSSRGLHRARVGAVGGLGRRTPADRRAGPGRLAARDRRGLSAPGAVGGDARGGALRLARPARGGVAARASERRRPPARTGDVDRSDAACSRGPAVLPAR